jgi:hypothetical protein
MLEETEQGGSLLSKRLPMCEECEKLNLKIAHFQRLVDPAMDSVTRDRTAKFIAEMTGEKVKLHPTPQKQG